MRTRVEDEGGEPGTGDDPPQARRGRGRVSAPRTVPAAAAAGPAVRQEAARWDILYCRRRRLPLPSAPPQNRRGCGQLPTALSSTRHNTRNTHPRTLAPTTPHAARLTRRRLPSPSPPPHRHRIHRRRPPALPQPECLACPRTPLADRLRFLHYQGLLSPSTASVLCTARRPPYKPSAGALPRSPSPAYTSDSWHSPALTRPPLSAHGTTSSCLLSAPPAYYARRKQPCKSPRIRPVLPARPDGSPLLK